MKACYVMFSVAETSDAGVNKSCARLAVNNVSDVGGGESMDCQAVLAPSSKNSSEKQQSAGEERNDAGGDTDVSSSADKHNSVLPLKAPRIKVSLI